jgi:hypothetical protein
LDYGIKFTYYPFKFNAALSKDNSFGDLVREVWNAQKEFTGAGEQSRLIGKLSILKDRVRKWTTIKKKREQQTFNQIENEIVTLIKESLDFPTATEPLNRLKVLENERNTMLMAEEDLWRQKSRAIWIRLGDKNTNFFHGFASFRRNKQHLWEVQDDYDHVHTRQEAIKAEDMRHFISFYKDSHNSIVDQIESIHLYPRLTTEEEVHILENPITKDEILVVLRGFTKDKSPSPDRWIVDFFFHFFDLVFDDILEVVEEPRLSSIVNRYLNSNFIDLIPKVNGPTSFGDFRSITLCNLIYKIITKILSNRIRHIMSRTLPEE